MNTNVNHARARPSVLPHLAYAAISLNAVVIMMMAIESELEDEGAIPSTMQQGLAAFVGILLAVPLFLLLVATIGILIALLVRAPRHALRIFLLVGAFIAVEMVVDVSGGPSRFKDWLEFGVLAVATAMPIVWLAQTFRSEPIVELRWLTGHPLVILVSSAVAAAVAAGAGGALVNLLTGLPVVTAVYAVFFGLLGGSVPIVVAGGRVLPEGGRRNPAEDPGA